MGPVPELTLELYLTPGKILAYYQGNAQTVRARATTGQYVQFPASALRQHVTPDGVNGLFRLEFDSNHKFLRLEQVRQE